jgi:hypothetical protein
MPLYPDESRRRPGTTASTSAGPAAHADDEAFLRLARERFNTVIEHESILRQEQLKDKQFVAGDQWEDKDRLSRARDKRPCLTINRLPQFKKQITGAQRANRQSIQINPVDDDSDPDTAQVFTDCIRHIENISHASVAYDTAVDDQVTMGRGYFRLITDYVDEMSFDLEILIKRIRNAHSVYYDPRCVEPDYSDGLYAFVVVEYSYEEFKRKWPTFAQDCAENAWAGIGNDFKVNWRLEKTGTVRVAEYFYVEFEDVKIVLLSDGQVLRGSRRRPEAVAESLAARRSLSEGARHRPDRRHARRAAAGRP